MKWTLNEPGKVTERARWRAVGMNFGEQARIFKNVESEAKKIDVGVCLQGQCLRNSMEV